MAFTVMIIVLLAALLHASWNFLVKFIFDKHLSMSAIVIGRIPYAVAALLWTPVPKPGSIPNKKSEQFCA